MPDAIVIGAGPNGLTAAAHLARAGWSVLVLEASDGPGGACRTKELTLPGFLHDIGAGFFPFGTVSPALAPLDLPGVGLVWKHAPLESCHPAPDGTSIAISRDLEATMASFQQDADAWRQIALWHRHSREATLDALLSPLPPIQALPHIGIENALTLMSIATVSARTFSRNRFSTEAAQRVVPGLGLHTDVGPDDFCGAIVGLMLATLASSSGFAVPEGGAGAITKALVRRIEERGGSIQYHTQANQIVVRSGRAVAVKISTNEEIEAKYAIVADVGAPALYLKLLAPEWVPGRIRRSMRRFPYGFGTFKMDWALDGPVPWSSEEATLSAVVHAGDSMDDLARFTKEVRNGQIPDYPYLVIGQQSLADPSRAPNGNHTLYAYSHAPSYPEKGWEAHRERFADSIESRIEGLAPGFKKRILARSITTPADLEAGNQNLVGGDLGGGSGAITNQLFFRPVFPYFRYRTPVKGLYLGSSYTHPGPGVHGACGRNAAFAALRDVRLRTGTAHTCYAACARRRSPAHARSPCGCSPSTGRAT